MRRNRCRASLELSVLAVAIKENAGISTLRACLKGALFFLDNSTPSLRSVSNVTATGIMSVLSNGRASYGVCKSSFLD